MRPPFARRNRYPVAPDPKNKSENQIGANRPSLTNTDGGLVTADTGTSVYLADVPEDQDLHRVRIEEVYPKIA